MSPQLIQHSVECLDAFLMQVALFFQTVQQGIILFQITFEIRQAQVGDIFYAHFVNFIQMLVEQAAAGDAWRSHDHKGGCWSRPEQEKGKETHVGQSGVGINGMRRMLSVFGLGFVVCCDGWMDH